MSIITLVPSAIATASEVIVLGPRLPACLAQNWSSEQKTEHVSPASVSIAIASRRPLDSLRRLRKAANKAGHSTPAARSVGPLDLVANTGLTSGAKVTVCMPAITVWHKSGKSSLQPDAMRHSSLLCTASSSPQMQRFDQSHHGNLESQGLGGQVANYLSEPTRQSSLSHTTSLSLTSMGQQGQGASVSNSFGQSSNKRGRDFAWQTNGVTNYFGGNGRRAGVTGLSVGGRASGLQATNSNPIVLTFLSQKPPSTDHEARHLCISMQPFEQVCLAPAILELDSNITKPTNGVVPPTAAATETLHTASTDRYAWRYLQKIIGRRIGNPASLSEGGRLSGPAETVILTRSTNPEPV
ncbi:unnamed protein product [Protopolystoma xenopodis]|uniref:Uncharacterized protein n=1 Tax=Protopolystoma xenopodis TaxID=117903 RepID=A0A3S5AAR9_9PLAT|nr:unnamed protein product [Protopolystoma xenopodis]